jgi:hypothetical protein
MMNPFGNDDEPVAPAWYLPTWPRWLATVAWYIRNPLHNFTHYMVGWKGRSYTVTYHHGSDADNDGFGNGWLIASLQTKDSLRPFISYAGRCHFYIGWHPASGKLGFKLTR